MDDSLIVKKTRHPVRNILLALFVILFCAIIIVGSYYGIRGYRIYRDAVSEQPLEERVDEIRDRDHFTRYSELSDFYIKAVISVEDCRFEQHGGIDPISILRALWVDIKTQSFEEGGSTITQQVAKNMLFTQEKKIERKVAEVFAAVALESNYEKNEIFELYVNTAYFGSGYYGIYDAAMGYYGKTPSELTDYEAAMLAGLPNAPSAYSPDTNMDLAVRRVRQVLDSMVENDILTEEEAEAIMSEAPAV